MATITEIFEALPDRYVPGQIDRPLRAYFSVGTEKWCVELTPEKATAQQGRPAGSADFVLKVDPKLFQRMVLEGRRPGPIDIARGKIKTNDVALLKRLPELFRLGKA